MYQNDIRRLKEEADIEQVIDYAGIEKHRRGGHYFILCPNPDHADHRATNCYFRRGSYGVRCEVCGRTFSPIDILMWTQNLSFSEACEVLWELEGRPDWYHARQDEKAVKRHFHVSASELKKLGLTFSDRVSVPVRDTKEREFKADELKKGYFYQKKEGRYVLMKSRTIPFSSYLSERKLRRLVKKAADRQLARLTKLEERVGYPMYEALKQDIRAIKKRAEEA